MRNQQRARGNRPLNPPIAGLTHLVYDNVIDRLRRHARSRGGERELARLDDRLLRDIGLTRSEIHAAAYGLLSGDRARGPAPQDTAGDQPIPTTPAKVAALVRELSDHLLHASTATEALHAWCAARGLSAGPITAVKQDPDQRRYPDDDMLDELRPERHERITYRCVRLVRGLVVLSEADNWFIPDRLPPEVRDLLEATDIPFGAAVARLQPSRRTYFVRFAELSTAAEAGTGGSAAGLSPSMPILEHKAVVLDRNRQPLSVVSERYCAALLSGVEAPSQAAGEHAPDERAAQR
jgi:uncharacterized protein YjiS (DUF1127 family)/chorismate-pyruvate lyase